MYKSAIPEQAEYAKLLHAAIAPIHRYGDAGAAAARRGAPPSGPKNA